jgi:hypothetical protein
MTDASIRFLAAFMENVFHLFEKLSTGKLINIKNVFLHSVHRAVKERMPSQAAPPAVLNADSFVMHASTDISECPTTVSVQITPDDDYVEQINRLLMIHERTEELRLNFTPATYHFYPESARELFCFVSNNDPGLRRIAFPLLSKQKITIDGHGAHFIFHGRTCPFLVRDCQEIEIRNITIDFARPSLSQGEVLKADDSSLTVRLDTPYPYEVADGQLWFTGNNYENRGASDGPRAKRGGYLRALAFDTIRREPAFMANDHSWLSTSAVAEIAPRTLRFDTRYPAPLPSPGNTLVLMHDRREMFGIAIDHSRSVTLDNVTIHHAGAMGVIAQRSQDITLHQVQVVPAQGRVFSTYADATHFVSCRGRISITACTFEGMMDDPVNVHGIYAPIARVLDDTHLEIVNAHYQQAGIPPVEPGSAAEVIDPETLLSKGIIEVEAVEPVNSGRWIITLSSCPIISLRPGDCLESLHWMPDVDIQHCRMGKNRARGPLITTAGKVLITHNHFHHAGSAIKISGDANSWFESGAVRDVYIGENCFDNCGFGPWGRGIIAIDPEVDRQTPPQRMLHRNIRIENNRFITFRKEILAARNVDGLRFQGNIVEPSEAYPLPALSDHWYLIQNCTQTSLQTLPSLTNHP